MGSPFETTNYSMNIASLGGPYDMYSKCRSLVEVWKVFNKMQLKKYNDLDHHDIKTCELSTRTSCIGTKFDKCKTKVCG